MTCAYCKDITLKKQQQRFCSVVCYGLYTREHGKANKGRAVMANFERISNKTQFQHPSYEKPKPKTYEDYLREAVQKGQTSEEAARIARSESSRR